MRSYVLSKPRLDSIGIDRVEGRIEDCLGGCLWEGKDLEVADLGDGDDSVGARRSNKRGRGNGGDTCRAGIEDEQVGQRISCIDSAFDRNLIRRRCSNADTIERLDTAHCDLPGAGAVLPTSDSLL